MEGTEGIKVKEADMEVRGREATAEEGRIQEGTEAGVKEAQKEDVGNAGDPTTLINAPQGCFSKDKYEHWLHYSKVWLPQTTVQMLQPYALHRRAQGCARASLKLKNRDCIKTLLGGA